MMSYFGLREWQFSNNNIDQLANLLRSQRNLKRSSKLNSNNGIITDAKHREPYLEFDMRTIDWNEYFFHYLPGIKKYFFKEQSADINKCINHYRR